MMPYRPPKRSMRRPSYMRGYGPDVQPFERMQDKISAKRKDAEWKEILRVLKEHGIEVASVRRLRAMGDEEGTRYAHWLYAEYERLKEEAER